MKRQKYRYIIPFILLVSILFIFIFKDILIQKAMIFYLNRQNIDCSIKHLTIKQFNSLKIENLRLKNSSFILDSRFVIIKINRNLTLDIYAKDSNLRLKNKIPSSKQQSLNIKRINRLQLVNISVATNNIIANDVNLNYSKGSLNLSGFFKIKNEQFYLKADINKLYSTIAIDKNTIILKSITIKPKQISLKYKQALLMLNRNIQIKRISLTLNPFLIKVHSAQTTTLLKTSNFNVLFFLNLSVDNNYIFLKANNVKSDSLNVKSVTIKTDKKYKNIKMVFKNISIEEKNLTAQNINAKIVLKNDIANILIDKGETVFFDKWYADFSNIPIKAVFNIKHLFIDINIKDVIKAHIEKNKIVKFNILSNKPKDVFNLFVKDLFESSLLQSALLSNNGKITINGVVYTDKKFYIKANLKLHDFKIGDIELGNIYLSVPIIYNINKKDKGYIKISNIDIFKHKVQLLSNISSSSGILKINTSIRTEDKNISFIPMETLINLNKKSVSTNLLFKLKMNNLYIDSKIKKMLIKDGNAKAKGTIYIKAFDGNIIVKNIHITDLYELPILVMDINFNKINLTKITQDTGFGLITGYVKGYINNLSLVDFEKPLSFVAVVRTDNTIKSQRRIALKAIKNISSIGGGYTNIVIPFFKTFPYSSIGFKATLKNNKFSLHGLYKSKDKEYIIKKELLIGVSVVNMNKNNSIDWEDMLNRIKRVMDKNNIKIE